MSLLINFGLIQHWDNEYFYLNIFELEKQQFVGWFTLQNRNKEFPQLIHIHF